MTQPRPNRKPTFLWQGVLILLPVTVMAVIALVAILQDRAAAERDAQRRADELLQRVAEGFERRLGGELTYASWLDLLWTRRHLQGPAFWPDSPWRRQYEDDQRVLAVQYNIAETNQQAIARAAGLPPEDLLCQTLSFELNGLPRDPDEHARQPQPPAWRLELSPTQQSAWNALVNLAPTPANANAIDQAVARFLETAPPEPARANAEFLRLAAHLPPAPSPSHSRSLDAKAAEQIRPEGTSDNSPVLQRWDESPTSEQVPKGRPTQAPASSPSRSNALTLPRSHDPVSQWLAFSTRCAGQFISAYSIGYPDDQWKDALSESGVPLSSLAVAKALQCARDTGPTEPLWQALVREVTRVPGFFTPVLLDLAEPLTRTRPDLAPALQTLRLHYAATEQTWDLADVLRQTTPLQGIITTNFWLDAQGIRWLCLLQPGLSPLRTNRAGQPLAFTNTFTEAHLYPKAAVEQAFLRAVQAQRLNLPPYLTLSLHLEAEPLSLRSTASTLQRSTAPTPPHPPLAQLEGHLTCPSSFTPSTGEPPVQFDALPGHPRFLLRAELTDRALLFAAQRRRTWLFSSLVAAAALTAAVGLFTARRSFQRQLKLNDLKSNFVSSVSHELRAPLASVRLMAESLERGKITEAPRQQEYFRFIVQECRRLSSLIENVLDFSRIEQGRKQYEFEPTDLLALVQQTLKLLDPYAAERRVHLALAVNPQLSTLNPQPVLDGKALQQALINLLDNAIKHSPPGETVTLGVEVQSSKFKVQSPEPSASAHASRITHHAPRPSPLAPHASRIMLSVSDHGPGIPPAEHEKIFERFYRRGSELRRETQGVGIGLSIVKHIVEAHGGRIVVRSAVGQGSRFTIELPLVNNKETQEPR